MALIRDYEIKETGLTVDNAYHVVKNVQVEKRYSDLPLPVDYTREDGITDAPEREDVYFKEGYVATIEIDIYFNQDCRNSGKKPLGSLGNLREYKFMFDPESSETILSQAYSYLKTTEYYQDAIEI
jgi:hypothetical protein